jgi:hypothetical protein
MSSSDDSLPKIHVIRGLRVVLDADLTVRFGVPTMRLNEAIRRSHERFPEDFSFRLTRDEVKNLKSQTAISSSHGGRRSAPRAFTEHGALMAGTVLNSPRAVQMSLFLVKAFIRMREALAANAVVLQRLSEIDRTLLEHDVVLRDVYEKLLPLLEPPPEPERPKIGFNPPSLEPARIQLTSVLRRLSSGLRFTAPATSGRGRNTRARP